MTNETVTHSPGFTAYLAWGDFDQAVSYAKSFAHMLDDLLCDSPGETSQNVNDPNGSVQRKEACLLAIQNQLDVITRITEEIRLLPAA